MYRTTAEDCLPWGERAIFLQSKKGAAVAGTELWKAVEKTENEYKDILHFRRKRTDKQVVDRNWLHLLKYRLLHCSSEVKYCTFTPTLLFENLCRFADSVSNTKYNQQMKHNTDLDGNIKTLNNIMIYTSTIIVLLNFDFLYLFCTITGVKILNAGLVIEYFCTVETQCLLDC